MSSQTVPWDRLVRFTCPDDTEIRYGEPILEARQVGDVADLAKNGKLQVKVLEGNNPLTATPTSKTMTVEKLLGPLDSSTVPIVRCVGLNYKTHILETGRPLPVCPTIFMKPGPTVADHNTAIPIPRIAQAQCDYEGELVVLIGRDAKDVSEEDALAYVAGYTVGNDISTRDWQRDTDKAGPVPQWSFSKSFDKYAPLGPCLVATHVLNDADDLELETRVNGELRQKTNTSDILFGVRKLIAFCSQGQTLQRGSLIMTGTPGGVGLFMKPPAFLADGDLVTVKVEKIGCLSNFIKFS